MAPEQLPESHAHVGDGAGEDQGRQGEGACAGELCPAVLILSPSPRFGESRPAVGHPCPTSLWRVASRGQSPSPFRHANVKTAGPIRAEAFQRLSAFLCLAAEVGLKKHNQKAYGMCGCCSLRPNPASVDTKGPASVPHPQHVYRKLCAATSADQFKDQAQLNRNQHATMLQLANCYTQHTTRSLHRLEREAEQRR
eukprot:364515-Chlamydomonas_euryale.AAC.2